MLGVEVYVSVATWVLSSTVSGISPPLPGVRVLSVEYMVWPQMRRRAMPVNSAVRITSPSAPEAFNWHAIVCSKWDS